MRDIYGQAGIRLTPIHSFHWLESRPELVFMAKEFGKPNTATTEIDFGKCVPLRCPGRRGKTILVHKLSLGHNKDQVCSLLCFLFCSLGSHF